MSVAHCEDAVQKFIVEMSSFVDAFYIWGITKLHHSLGRALNDFAPIVSGSSASLNSVLEEFKLVRDRVSCNLNIYQAMCNTDMERRNWDRQYAGFSDSDALIHLRSARRRFSQFPVLANTRDYKRNLRASLVICLWFNEIRNHSFLISWKTWDQEDALQCFTVYLKHFASEFLQFTNRVTFNLSHFVEISCNEAFPFLFETAQDYEDHDGMTTLRVRSALAAAVYRRAFHVNPTMRNLPRIAYWEILSANTSMFSFSLVASDESLIEKNGLIYPDKLHTLPTSELKVCQQDLVSLWNLAASILDNPVWQLHLINLMKMIDAKIKSSGVVWPEELEGDRVALHYYIIGCSYAGMGFHDLAIDYLLKVPKMKNQLKTDLFLIPFSIMEAAMCHYAKHRNGTAESLVQTAFQQYSFSSREFRMLVHAYDYARRHPITKNYLLDTEQEDLNYPEDYPDLGLEYHIDENEGNPDNVQRGVPPQQGVGNVDEESVEVEEKPATEDELTDEEEETAASSAIPSTSGAGASTDMDTGAQDPMANKASDTTDMYKYKNITGFVEDLDSEDSADYKVKVENVFWIRKDGKLFVLIQNSDSSDDALDDALDDAAALARADHDDAPLQFGSDEDDDFDFGEDLKNLFADEE